MLDTSEGWELPPRGPRYPSPSSTSPAGVADTSHTLYVLKLQAAQAAETPPSETTKQTTRQCGFHVHRVEWFLDHDMVTGDLICEESEGAPCRRICPNGHETWPCGCELIDNGECNAVEWIDNGGGLTEFYADRERVPLRDGLVEVEWDGDTWLWRYSQSGRGQEATDETVTAPSDTAHTGGSVDRVTLDIEIIQDWADALDLAEDGDEEALASVISDLKAMLSHG